MKPLNDYIPQGDLSAIEYRRLEYFYEQFVLRHFQEYGPGHLLLAGYAALPAVLTPDLLYKIWLNFKTYTYQDKPMVIHPVAPADLLLSPLVEEIGTDLYEMPEPVRKALLLYMKQATASGAPDEPVPFRLELLARFLKDYVQYDFTPGNDDDDAFREAQEWTAESYLDPGKAFATVAKAFNESQTNAGKARYRDAIGKMSTRFALNIVREGSTVPEGYKAMNALVSVMKDMIRGRTPEQLDLLRTEALRTEGLLTDQPLPGDNVIHIEVPDIVRNSSTLQRPKASRRLLMMAVGINDKEHPGHVQSAQMVHDLLTADAYYVSYGQAATKTGIIDQLTAMMNDAGEQDDVILYIAAPGERRDVHTAIVCAAPSSTDTRDSRFLADAEIADIVKGGRYASLTLILETDHAATRSWLDTEDPRHVVMAGCHPGQKARLTQQGYGAFTLALLEAFEQRKDTIPNRDLFAMILKRYERLADFGADGERILPWLLCAKPALDRVFLHGNNQTAVLQSLLRDLALLEGDHSVSGLWDELTAKALGTYLQNAGEERMLSKREYIGQLRDAAGKRLEQEPPVFLLIFSDPEHLLKGVKEEMGQIVKTIRNSGLQVQIETLVDPGFDKLNAMLERDEYRNRIELIYYTGSDSGEGFLLKDGPYGPYDFAYELRYQKNIKLLVGNTCYSARVVERLCQLGIQAAIGVERIISDETGRDFSLKLFDWIAGGHSIRDFISQLEIPVEEKKEILFFDTPGQEGASPVLWSPRKKEETGSDIRVFSLFVTPQYYDNKASPQERYKAMDALAGLIRDADEVSNHIQLAGSDITRETVDDALNRLCRLAEPGGKQRKRLVIYFAGEGVLDTINPFLFLPGQEGSLDIQAYFSLLCNMGVFAHVVFFYDLSRQSHLFKGQVLSPAFGAAPLPLNTVPGLLMGHFSSGALLSLESYSSLAGDSEGHFTEVLLAALTEAIGKGDRYLRLTTLRDYMQHALPGARSVLTGSAPDFILFPLPEQHPRLYRIMVPDEGKDHWLRITSGAGKIVYEDYADQPAVEAYLSPGSYAIEIVETGIRRSLQATAGDAPVVFNLAWKFREQWICVVGSAAELNPEQAFAAELVGRLLAHEGYGLLTGGWPGVDELVARSFNEAIRQYVPDGQNPYLLQLIEEGDGGIRRIGEVISCGKGTWMAEVYERCDAIIALGGQGFVYNLFLNARKRLMPFIPVPRIGGSAEDIFGIMMRDEQSSSSLWKLSEVPVREEERFTAVLLEILSESAPELINPYKGAEPYTKDDAALFFGRSRVLDGWNEGRRKIKGLRERVEHYRIVIIACPPASGVTSLLNTGILPAYSGVLRLNTDHIKVSREDHQQSLVVARDCMIVIEHYEQLLDLPEKERIAFEDTVKKAAAHNKIILTVDPGKEMLFKDSPVLAYKRERNNVDISKIKDKDTCRFELPDFSQPEYLEIVTQPLVSQSLVLGYGDKDADAFARRIVTEAALFPFAIPYVSVAMQRLVEKRKGNRLLERVYDDFGGISGIEQQLNPESFKEKVERLYRQKKIKEANDPQKGRWGGASEREGWTLRAFVSEGRKSGYKVTLNLSSRAKVPPSQQIAILLHEDVQEDIWFDTVKGGHYVVEVGSDEVFEAFTIGVVLEDGTQLELDLNEQPGYPKSFYHKEIASSFRSQVKELYASRPVTVKDDLQKGRWGGQSHAGGLVLAAEVTKRILGFYNVVLSVRSETGKVFMGDVAFFVHNTFNNEIIFRKSVSGVARTNLTAYEAFAVGAYTQDGVMLELDLNEVPGFPKGFYYKP